MIADHDGNAAAKNAAEAHSDEEPNVSGPAAAKNAADRDLVGRVTAGSREAWHEFITRYSGLIFAVLRRYIFDEDDLRNVYVDVLEGLYRGKLTTFEGRSALSTWLVLVARNAALDHLRRRFGRRDVPSSIQRLSKLDQQVFRLYYLEGMSFDGVREWAAPGSLPLSADAVAAALARIDAQLDDHVLRRIAYNLHAPSVGAASGRMMEFLEWHRSRQEELRRSRNPEQELLEKEAHRTAERVHELLARLPEEERRALTLRFDRGWTAAHIAEEMGLESPRRAYTVIDRGLRQLRALLARTSPMRHRER